MCKWMCVPVPFTSVFAVCGAINEYISSGATSSSDVKVLHCWGSTPFTLRTTPYDDVVIEHVDFYGSVHTHCVAVPYGDGRDNELDLCGMLRCVAVRRQRKKIVPIDNNGK